MAKEEMTVRVRVTDMPTVKLLYLELVALVDEMRVAASPFAPRLEAIVERFESRRAEPDGDQP